MSHRTAATALLLASLPYGLALPQVIPLVSELAPAVTPGPLILPLAPEFSASKVTIGTAVEPAVESAIEDVGDIVEDATETAASALESATDAIWDALPTDVPSILDPEADILPLVLPGILPVETDLPPLDPPDVVPSDLPALDDGTLNGDDLPDTNGLDVVDLPAPSEVPYGDDGLIADPLDPILSDPTPPVQDFPDFPDSPKEQTVPISTFNAVVQPLISVIQTLLNSLPGNFAPPLPGILSHPLLPTATPDIFVDPILPTETPNILVDPLLPTETRNDAAVATATEAVDPLFDSLIPLISDSVATDLPFAKRQEPTDLDTSSIYALIAPIIDAINALVAQVPAVGPAMSDAVSSVESAVPDLHLPISNITLPVLPLPTLPSDVLDELPVNVSAVPEPSFPAQTLPADVGSLLPTNVQDLTSDIPTDVLNVPVPEVDEFGVPIDSPLDAADLPAAIPSLPLPSLPLPTSLDAFSIPADVLNVPVPDVDEFGVPINGPLDAVSALPSAPSALPDLLDWPFDDWQIPGSSTPDVNGALPIPTDVLNVPVPNLDDISVPINLPTGLPASALPEKAFGAGFPIQALPDMPLVLPSAATDALPILSTDALPSLPTEALLPAEGLPGLPTEPLSAVTTDALSGLPTGLIADILPNPPTLPTEALPVSKVSAVSTLIVSAVPTIPALPVVPTLQGIVPLNASAAPTVPALPAVPAIPTLQGIVPKPFTIPRLPLQVPGPLAKREVMAAQATPAALPPGSDIALGLIKPLLSLLSSLLAKLPLMDNKVPDLGAGLPVPSIASVLPAVPAIPAVGSLVPSLSAVPNVTSILPTLPAVSAIPAVSDVAGVLPAVPEVASVLRAAHSGGLLAPALTLSPLPEATGPLQGLPATPGVASILPAVPEVASVLRAAHSGGLLAPALTLPPLPEVTGLSQGLPATPDVASILPAVPDVTSVLPDLSAAVPAVPNVGGLASSVTGAVSAVPGIGEVASTVSDAVPKVPLALDSGLTKRQLPTADSLDTAQVLDLVKTISTLITGLLKAITPAANTLPTVSLPLVRRAVEELQQGPASDWESFLGDLDESKQGELHKLVHDSAKAVNNGELESLASKLKTDFEDLSEDTKAMLRTAAPALANMEKRTMRHGKRQSGIPGAQSIGPNLDDAPKVDLSGILGQAGTLDPLGQLSQSGEAGSVVDDLPDSYIPPLPSNQLDDSSEDPSLNPDLSAILGPAGTLDPNGMLGSQVGQPGSVVDDKNAGQDPYADIRGGAWDSALSGPPAQALDGLAATIQASKNNRIGGAPNLPFAPSSPPGGSAAAAQAQAAAVLKWFQRYVQPSGRSDVDATFVR